MCLFSRWISIGVEEINAVTEGYFGYCSTVPYEDAEPDKAKQWVEKNVEKATKPGNVLSTQIGSKYNLRCLERNIFVSYALNQLLNTKYYMPCQKALSHESALMQPKGELILWTSTSRLLTGAVFISP